jgi:polyphosphate kinase
MASGKIFYEYVIRNCHVQSVTKLSFPLFTVNKRHKKKPEKSRMLAAKNVVRPSNRPRPAHFLNREIQLLAFNRRVLAQASDAAIPLLERLKFLSIVSSNLDEFFEIRVAGLKEQIKLNASAESVDGRSALATYHLVAEDAHNLVAEQYALLNDALLPALAAQKIRFVRRGDWTPQQREWVKNFFFREMMPVLTPIGLDPAHPFPRVFNKSLNFAVELAGRDAFGRDAQRAIVQAPRVLPRVIKLPTQIASRKDAGDEFVFLTSILHAHVGELFTGLEVRGCYQFRVTRNSDLFVDEEEVKNLRIALQGELPQRHLGDAVRLEVADLCSEEMATFLLQQFDLESMDLYRVNGPVNLVRLMSIPDQVARPELKFPPFVAALPKPLRKVAGKLARQSVHVLRRATLDAPLDAKGAPSGSESSKEGVNLFETLKKTDVLLHHPFESFAPVVEFIQQAARDLDVVAIKQTVYRTGTDSAIMEALIDAAKRGKEVTVVVELMARFDEEANLNWAARLEAVGAHVVYGVVGHKTHAKMALVVRREQVKGSAHPMLRRYVHVGTGNYHARTARLYTDFGLLTADEAIAADVNEVFMQLTGLGKATKLKHIWQSPFALHEKVLAAIERETKSAKAGKRAAIIAKMNSLLDPQVIEALYRASKAGVKIDLIVRGVCVLKPGVPGLSENIRVRSIVGRFLEHSRIFYFREDGAERVMISSADWMERNFFRRIETCIPILDKKLKRRVIDEGLKPYLADNVDAWEMDGVGSYARQGARSKARPTQAITSTGKPKASARGAKPTPQSPVSAQRMLLDLLATE